MSTKFKLLGVLFIVFMTSCNTKNKQKETVKKVKKPNIIWLMAEDISTDLECYGMPNVKTPNLNKMASKGIRFKNAFVTNPICSPSRSSMMIGTHQVKTNTHNHRSNRDVPLDSQFTPFTELLRQNGYTTIIGNHAVYTKGRKIDVNFKSESIGEWDGKTKFGLFDKYDTFEKKDEPFFAQIQLKITHRGDWWTEIREKSKHPVDTETLTLPPYMADHPAIRLDWAKYLDQIEYMDNEVGMIFKELEDKGLADNTIVIFIGDNGRCNIKGKGYLQDPGLRIPLIIYNPREVNLGGVNEKVIASTDITATILDYAGVEIPEFMTGQPIFRKDFNREFVYGARDLWDEIEEKSRSLSSGKWTYIRNDKPEIPYDAHQAYLEFFRPAVHVMRTLYKEGKLNENQKPFFEAQKPKEELYDMEKDPYQLNNLASNSTYSNLLNQLRVKMLEYDKAMQPVSLVYEPKTPMSVEVLSWIQNNLPEEYKKMQEGEEIGLSRIKKIYKESKK